MPPASSTLVKAASRTVFDALPSLDRAIPKIAPTGLILRTYKIDELSNTEVEALCDVLSSDELDRARAAKNDKLFKSRIVGRALLRHQLSQITSLRPGDICLQSTPLGKPFLADADWQKLKFSLAYSRQYVIYAFSENLEIGIDLEFIDESIISDALIADVLHKEEQDLIRHLPLADKANIFFALWTAKEALLKASGNGLSGLDHLNQRAFKQSLKYFGQKWQTTPLDLPAGFAGALAWPLGAQNV